MIISNSFQLLRRAWYFSDISDFLKTPIEQIITHLAFESSFPVLQTQKDAWIKEIYILHAALEDRSGRIYLEFEIPRIGHRVDAIIFLKGTILVLEFKIGSEEFLGHDIDQAYDYAMDLKYFHEASHQLNIIPVLVASEAKSKPFILEPNKRMDELYETVCATSSNLKLIIQDISALFPDVNIDITTWETSRYCPTSTIIEAARALYAGHGVADISRNDAGAINIKDTSNQLEKIIEYTRTEKRKAICFITGVPGAGKTLIGLNMATRIEI